MIKKITFFCFLISYTLTLIASIKPTLYPMMSHIKTTSQGLITMDIDPRMYQNLNENLSNMAFFSNDELVPFSVQIKRQILKKEVLSQIKTKILSLKPLKNNSLEVIIEAKQQKPLSKITINTPTKNFEKTLTLYASQDEITWIKLQQNMIYDYSKYMSENKTEITVPQQAYPFYKIIFSKISESEESPITTLTVSESNKNTLHTYQKKMIHQPFKITNIIFYTPETILSWGDKITHKINPIWLDVNKTNKSKNEETTTINIILNKQPVTGFIITSPTVLFSRNITLLVNETPHGTYSLLQQDGNNLKINLNHELRYQQVTLKINNQDNPPLDIKQIQAISPVYQIVFMNTNYPNITLYYGGPTTKMPQFNIQSYITPSSVTHSGSGAFGSLVKNSTYMQITEKSSLLNSKTLFKFIIILVMFVMLILIYIAIKKYKIIPDD